MTISNNKFISPFIAGQLPEFVRVDHPTFVTFLNYYYEWLETQKENVLNPLAVEEITTLDTTLNTFIDSFKKQYLQDFPQNLAISSETGLPVDPKKLIKNIKYFYRAKGTEKSFQFLFRILYDTNLEFYYPKVDILKCSDGKWIQNNTLRITTTLGKKIFDCIGKKIYQSSNNTITASAEVVDANKYQFFSFDVAELYLKNINGTFAADQPVYFEEDTNRFTEQRIYSVVSGFSISSGGFNYSIGDIIKFVANNDTGQGAEAKVTQVSSSGTIQQIQFTNFGLNYKNTPTIQVTSQKGYGLTGTVTLGSVCRYPGYYSNNDGKLSSNKVLQDNHYYQNYSYVLKCEVTINKYRDIIKRLIHPAGLGFFGQVQIKKCIFSEVDKANILSKYEIPFIGNYLPYTFQTYDDLSQWFVSGGISAGFNSTGHTPLIQSVGAGLAVIGNPISNFVPFDPFTGPYASAIGFDLGDPFFIVYQHPNRKIKGNVPAKIYQSQKDDFLGSTGASGWNEWVLNSDTENRNNWANSFTGNYQYAILSYTGTTEFRKITIGSFLEMPKGDIFDCRYDNGIRK